MSAKEFRDHLRWSVKVHNPIAYFKTEDVHRFAMRARVCEWVAIVETAILADLFLLWLLGKI